MSEVSTFFRLQKHCLMCSEEGLVYITEDLAQKELVSFSSLLLEGHANPPLVAP